MDIDDDARGGLPVRLPADGDGLLTGTAVFDALFAALELAAPAADMTSLGLLLGSSSQAFG